MRGEATVGPAPKLCLDGGTEHRVPIQTKYRPLHLRCSRCRKLFVRDKAWRQGYRPATDLEDRGVDPA